MVDAAQEQREAIEAEATRVKEEAEVDQCASHSAACLYDSAPVCVD